jgi:hypothetical protein
MSPPFEPAFDLKEWESYDRHREPWVKQMRALSWANESPMIDTKSLELGK